MGIGFELPQSSYPCLHRGVVDDEESEEFFPNIFEEHPFSVKNPYLRNNYVLSSRYGWWVLQDCDNEGCIFILNPLSMERIELPKLESPIDMCILSSSPKDPGCRIVLFNGGSKNILFCRIGDSEFTKEELENEVKNDFSGIVVNGTIYSLIRDFDMVSISFEGQSVKIRTETTLVHHFTPSPPGSCRFRSYLIESNNKLLNVNMYFSSTFSWEVADFGIHKFDTCTSSWKELRTIGDHRALFLDDSEGISCNVDREREGIIKGNCIYYIDSDNPLDVNIFCLKEGSFSILPMSRFAAKQKQDGEHWFRWISLPSP